MSTIEKKFGQVVREARAKQGWSQERLAEVADLNRSFLGEIERGVATPSLSTVDKLAAALEIAPSVLISRCEKN